MFELSVITAIIVFGILISPFFLPAGKPLEVSLSTTSLEKITLFKKSLILQLYENEEAYKNKIIGEEAFNEKKKILISKYIYITGRFEYLTQKSLLK